MFRIRQLAADPIHTDYIFTNRHLIQVVPTYVTQKLSVGCDIADADLWSKSAVSRIVNMTPVQLNPSKRLRYIICSTRLSTTDQSPPV